MSNPEHPTRLNTEQVYWHCDPGIFDFETTESVDPAMDVLGQDTARSALEFGIRCFAPGQNVYIRGARGTGRKRMVAQLLEQIQPQTDAKRDFLYVHNFHRPQQPRLITLPPCTAGRFRKLVAELAEFATRGLGKALDEEPFRSQRADLQNELQRSVAEITGPLEEALAENGLALVATQNGPASQTMIFPLHEGQPIPPNQLRALVAEGKVPEEDWQAFQEAAPQFQERLAETGKQAAETFRAGHQRIQQWLNESARTLLQQYADPIISRFPQPAVSRFLDELIADVIETRLLDSPETAEPDGIQRYGVNVVLTHDEPQQRTVVVEVAPSLINLLGIVEPTLAKEGMAVTDYRGIRAGALLNADQGYLILDVKDVLNEPGAWRGLLRTLRTGQLEIVPPEAGWLQPHVVIQPEPIPLKVRVILIGDVRTYYQLDRWDPDFRELFKVLADFDAELVRSDESAYQYASVISYLCHAEGLPPFDRHAIAALAEHGARVAGRRDKLTARFGRIADIAREAAFLAAGDTVQRDHVRRAVDRTKQRASLPSRKFQEMVESKTILVQTTGQVVGQVNGLAVMHAGPLTYGFPARITASIGPGRAGLINIEGHAQMSGAIHTKGFHILGGLLRRLLPIRHPLAFSASLAFEQSYGGIEGDSASGAEIICLLSALTGQPVLQSMAMTGAIDQLGRVEAIGGVNEKIEGFFDACDHFGLTHDQGVVIPQANAADLQLRDDVVRAIDQSRFHVFAVDDIYDAIELMTGTPAGQLVDGAYPDGTLLSLAMRRATEFWEQTLASPDDFTRVERGQSTVILPDDHS